MIQPALTDDAFLADVAEALKSSIVDNVSLWWLGQSGFLVQWNRRHLLVDPYLSDSLTKKYATTDRPHVRMTAHVVSPDRLDFIDVVTSSHNHTDHLDAETLKPLIAANPKMAMIIPEANRKFVAERLGSPLEWPIGLDSNTSTTASHFEIYGVPAAHETIERDPAGRCRFLGYVIRCGRWTIYHSGDTLRFDGMAENLKPWNVDVALLPINGRAPERRVAGNLDGREAAELAHDIGAKQVIPCHYEMFEFNTASPDLFVTRCKELGQHFTVLRAGERHSIAH